MGIDARIAERRVYKMSEILKKPRHPERAEYIEWLGLAPGEKWDAKFCSIREVNKRLVLLER